LPFGTYDTFSIGLVILTYDVFTLKLVHIIVRGMHNQATNFAVSGTFNSSLMGQHLLEGPRNLVTVTLDLGGHGTAHVAALHASTVYQVSSW